MELKLGRDIGHDGCRPRPGCKSGFFDIDKMHLIGKRVLEGEGKQAYCAGRECTPPREAIQGRSYQVTIVNVHNVNDSLLEL